MPGDGRAGSGTASVEHVRCDGCDLPIATMVDAMRRGQLSSSGLVGGFTERMDAHARLRAVIERNPDAPALAAARDAERDARAPLGGVPILLKDNIDTGDRLHTTAGSLALAENRAPQDAPLVARLRGAGAVILGKTNMSEFANYMTGGKAPNGYSSRGASTLNPFDETADPSGSSTGSAVALATGQCAAAIGTETCGSIISPSQRAGIVGLKPTVGLVPSAGVIPISPTLDTPGPMARTIADVAIVLGVLTGAAYDLRGELAGARIGLVRPAGDGDAEWRAAAERVADLGRRQGVTWVDVHLPSHDLGAILSPIMRCEFAAALDAYLASMRNPAIPPTLAAIIAFNQAHADVALRYGQSELLEAATASPDDPAYRDALDARDALIARFDAAFARHGVDVLFLLDADTDIAALTGFPSLTLPLGRTSAGLPIGSGFIARRGREDALLRVAAAFETALGRP